MNQISINPNLSIPEDEIEFTFIRSSGPGGQRVNKVSTAVQLRFNVVDSPSLPETVRTRLIQIAGRRVNAAGVLTIEARTHRSQERNRRKALDRFVDLLSQAAIEPTSRKATRPTQASVVRRLTDKRRQAEKKRLRKTSKEPGDPGE